MPWKSAAIVATNNKIISLRPAFNDNQLYNSYHRNSNSRDFSPTRGPDNIQQHQSDRRPTHGFVDLDASCISGSSAPKSEGYKSILKTFISKILEMFSLQNLINLVFVVAVCFVCFQQCSLTIKEYMKYESRVFIVKKLPNNLVVILPGITICNNNRILMAKLVERYPLLKEGLHELRKNNSLTQDQLQTQIKRVLESTVDLRKVLYQSPISEVMILSNHSDLITQLSCNHIWGNKINCGAIPIYQSYQSTTCSTLFYSGGLVEGMANGAVYRSNSSRFKQKEDSFHSGEVAEIEVNFNPYEYTDLRRDVGGQITIHSPRNVGSVREVAYNILPGYRYEFFLTLERFRRLPPPYVTNCYDYYQKNKEKFESNEKVYPNTELDQTTCIRNCIVKNTVEACQCWPVEVPYYYGDKAFDKNNSLVMCPWGHDDDFTNTSASLYFTCYKRFSDMCKRMCPMACDSYKYNVKAKSSEWVTKADRAFTTKKEAQRNELIRKYSSALLSIKYKEYETTDYIYYPSLSLAQMMSNLGGIVSSLIGISGITIYRYVTRNILGCQVENQA